MTITNFTDIDLQAPPSFGAFSMLGSQLSPSFLEYLDLDALIQLSSTNKVFYQLIQNATQVWGSIGRFLGLLQPTLQGLKKKVGNLRLVIYFQIPALPIPVSNYLSLQGISTLQKARDTLVVWEALADKINGEPPLKKFDSDRAVIEEAEKFHAWFENHREALNGIRTLSLNEMGLHFLPPEISQLENIRALELFSNYMGEEGLANLPLNLRRLYLGHNHLSCVSPHLLKLKKLRNLDLSSNRLSSKDACDNLPTSIRRLTLDGNHLKKVPAKCAELRYLSKLDLSRNELSEKDAYDHLPKDIGELVLCGCNLNKVPPEFLKLNIDKLDLSWNPLNEENAYTYLPKTLTSLTLRECDLYEVPAQLLELENLRELNFNRNHLNQEQAFTHLPLNLTLLALQNNKLATVPDKILNLPHLEILNLSNNLISSVPAALSQLGHLRILVLENNDLEELSDEFLVRARQNMAISIAKNPLTKDFQERWDANNSLRIIDALGN